MAAAHTQGYGNGARQRRNRDHGARLELLLGVVHGVAQNEAPFGIRVVDLQSIQDWKRSSLSQPQLNNPSDLTRALV
jgi:hypothetical protein